MALSVKFKADQLDVHAFLELLVNLEVEVIVELVGVGQVSPNMLGFIDNLAEVEVERLTHGLSEGKS